MPFIFIFGPARSGTSALTWELNAAGDTFVIPELNAALVDAEGRSPRGNHFTREYIERVVAGPMSLMLQNLDLFMPYARCVTPEKVIDFLAQFQLPQDLLLYLTNFYGAVGTKVVLFGSPPVLDVLYRYQQLHYRDELHIATWRSPDDIIGSTSRLFRSLALDDIVANVAAAYTVTLQMLAEFPNRVIVLNGTLTSDGLNAIRQRVGLPARGGTTEIDRQFITNYAPVAIAALAQPQRDTLFRLREVNRRLQRDLIWQNGIADIDATVARRLREDLLHDR